MKYKQKVQMHPRKEKAKYVTMFNDLQIHSFWDQVFNPIFIVFLPRKYWEIEISFGFYSD